MENFLDSLAKLLIGYETGTCIMWNLLSRAAETRFHCPSNLTSLAWHYDGKQFITGMAKNPTSF